MLSKSQARAFFLGGTVIFSGVFIALTVDTVRQTDARTKSQNLTDAVKRGKLIWEKNNCMGCHTILGEGAYYAPELTKVFEKRGEAFIRTFIKDPQAMYPGERKMVKYNFSDAEITDVIAFLKWVGEIDTNGWPPKPDIVAPSAATQVNTPVATNTPETKAVPQPEKFAQLCIACHSLSGKGGVVGPQLDKVGAKYDATYFDKWLKDPQSVKPGTAMPKLPLSDAERADIVRYLAAQK
ncbi:MAG: c-type cytochrome [Spirochaetes bacterium]|nr:c-type cytochrome [Spirochaetota bacterium]MBX3721208.1 c-type cytochrome [Turneriella sp.]